MAVKHPDTRLRLRVILGHVGVIGIIAITWIIATRIPVQEDVAWLLYVAEQWLDGHRPYVALVEINPPLIIWISIVPVALARVLGVSSLLVAPLFFASILLGCVWWAAGILHRRDTRYDHRLTFAIVAAVLLLVPGVDFWQREHLLLAGALPYLALRMGSTRLPERSRTFQVEALLAGVLVGLCCALKPWYALPFVLVEWVAVAGGARLLREAVLGACVTGLVFVAAVIVVNKEYIRDVVPLAFHFYKDETLTWLGMLKQSPRLPVGLVAAGVLWWVARRNMHDGGTTRILLVFAVGATIAYLLQGKGYWFYQRIPAVAAVLLVLLSLATALLRHPSFPHLSARPLGLCLLAAVIFLGLAWPSARQLEQMARGIPATPTQRIQAHLIGVLRAEGARSYVAFSRILGIGFPVVNQTGVVWASRFASTWALYAAYLRSLSNTSDPDVMRQVVDWMVQDFLAICPDLVAVDGRDGVDYLHLMQAADVTFAQAWAAYRFLSAFERVRIYHRTGRVPSVDTCGSPAALATTPR
jgi:hypothetical protein